MIVNKRIFEDNKNLLFLFFLLIYGEILGYFGGQYQVQTLVLFIIYFSILIKYMKNIKYNLVFLIFLGMFFLFMLGNIFFSLIDNNGLYFLNFGPTNKRIIRLLQISLLSVTFGYELFTEKKERADYKGVLNKKIILLFVIIFFVCLVPQVLVILEKINFLKNHSYADLYKNFQTNYPYIILKMASLFQLSFYFILGLKLGKNKTLIFSFVYLLVQSLNFLAGQRELVMINLLVILAYLYYRNIFEEWFDKNTVYRLILTIPLLILFLLLVQNARVDNEQQYGLIEKFVEFFKTQGDSYRLLGFGLENQPIIPENRFYSFGDIKNIVTNNRVIHSVFNTNIYTSNTVEAALYSSSFQNVIAYIVSPEYYLKGGGFGSSYIIELFIDFGIAGVIVGNMLFGILLYCFRLPRKSIISLVISLLMIGEIFYAPRSSFSRFIARPLSFTYLIIFICIKFLTYILDNKNLLLKDRLIFYTKTKNIKFNDNCDNCDIVLKPGQLKNISVVHELTLSSISLIVFITSTVFLNSVYKLLKSNKNLKNFKSDVKSNYYIYRNIVFLKWYFFKSSYRFKDKYVCLDYYDSLVYQEINRYIAINPAIECYSYE